MIMNAIIPWCQIDPISLCFIPKPTFWFPTWFDTNQAVQLQKMVRGLKFGFRKKRDCTVHVAKTKALISFAVTAKLICVFVFAYAKIRFSHDAAQISLCFIPKVVRRSFVYTCQLGCNSLGHCVL